MTHLSAFCAALLHATTTALARTWAILAFLALVTLVAELCQEAGIFELAGHHAARAARGSVLGLLGLVCGLAVVTTVGLSLDTTVVLVTPVALALVAGLDLPLAPFAYACVWLANGASLLLPIANLTGLLAQDRLGLSSAAFAARMWAPQLAVLVVTLAVLVLRHRASLAGRYQVPVEPPAHDRVLTGVGAVAAGVVAAGTVAGLAAWQAAAAATGLLVVAFGWRRPHAVRPGRLVRMVPWATILQTAALFVAVEAAGPLLRPLVAPAVGGHGQGLTPLLAAGGMAALAGNLLNNLPAYLLIEGSTQDRTHLLAVLVGVGAGPQVLLWGSVATLLWRDRVRAAGHRVDAWEFARQGLMLTPLAVGAGVAALALG
ncbi:SLC13 family permease [Arsenicicoccus dermatophilus]|uniref:SLC13 family permease n=1 Tax=Arsenicicoccus dermatophilus TaxID=1076331 RepID=UPI001F4CF267|nr:arsenic transporter [Arsenicicoccus dermatophilus]